MRIELALRLLGPHAGMDAQESLQALTTTLALLRELEATETARPSGNGTRWTFNELRLGSVACTLEPLRIAEHSTYDVVERVARSAVGGLREAESAARIPTGWTLRAANLGRRVAKSLGASPDVGMILEVRGDGEPLRTAEITQRTALHLESATRTRHHTFGSRRGRLSGLHEGGRQRRPRALLRTEVGGEVIPVYFGDDLDPELRRAWRRDRVEITGEITENAQGQSMWMRARDIELLPTQPQLSDDDLRGGFWPDMTGGQDAVEYVEALRGDT
ncbi:hypothetical protein ACFUMJ_18225 [Streptomyces olivaceus]|uniref:hypothetical protein n=1 Tax=Streptomyces TaxID=1883 RepID=UPI001FB7E342|nr:hypothetical protein [Streptomyces sp. CB09030]UOG83913.1 hypothetical protein L6J92_34225 [Streptomyces sp. CB09030]